MAKHQRKVILLVIISLAVALIAVGWQTRQLLLEERMSASTDATLKQIAPLKRLIQEKIESGRDHLVRFATGRMVQGAGRETSFGPFDVIAVVEPNGDSWTPAWVERGGNAKTAAWPPQFDLTLLKSLPYSKSKEGEVYWARVSDAQGAPIYAMLVPVDIQLPPPQAATVPGAVLPEAVGSASALPTTKKAVIVGFASNNVLAGVVEDYIGSSSSAYVVDDQGYIASHVDKTYLGALFTEDNIVKAIQKGDRTSGSGRFTDFDGHSVLAHFEKIDHSNLFAVMTTPMAVINRPIESILRSLASTAGVLLFLALAISWIVARTMQVELVRVPIATPIPETKPVEKPHETAAPVSQEALIQERRSAFETLSAGIDEAVREPLLAILGHAQLLQAKAQDDDLREHAESLARDARQAKETLDHLREFSQPDLPITVDSKVNLQQVLSNALAQAEDLLNADVIEVVKEILPVPDIVGIGSEIQTALVCILENAIEAVHNRDQKEIRITLEYLNERVFLGISDTGVGMSRDIQSHAFEPFVKGFESPAHMGLGLAHVDKIMRHHGADRELESAPGVGTTVTLIFSVDADDLRRFQHHSTAPTDVSPPPIHDNSPETPIAEVPTPPVPLAPAQMPNFLGQTPPPIPPLFANMKPLAPEFAEQLPPSPHEGGDEMDSVAFAQISDIDQSQNESAKAEEAVAMPPPTPDANAEFKVKIRRPKPKG